MSDTDFIGEVVQPSGQGQPSPDTPAVQPSSGQGQSGDTSTVQPGGQGHDVNETGLYDLSTVPEELRDSVAPILREIEGNATKKFQQHADFRRQWEPYESLGINELDPEGLGNLLEFARALDGDGAREAILGLAEALEVDLTGEPGEPDPLSDVRSELEELRAWKASQEEERQLDTIRAETSQRIQAEWAAVQERHGREFTDEEVDSLRELATAFLEAGKDEPITKAYEFIHGLTGRAATNFVENAPTQPAPAEPGGRAATTAEPVTSFEDAERLLRERRQQRAALAAA